MGLSRERATLLAGLGACTGVIIGGTWIVKWLCLPADTAVIAGNVAIALTGLIIFWYTLETSRLRRQSASQTEATRDQARITRQIFEASQRPFLQIELEGHSFVNDADHYSLLCAVTNHGPVPAILRRWVITLVLNGEAVREHVSEPLTRALFVGNNVPVEAALAPQGTQVREDVPDVTVKVSVRYESPAGFPYESWLNVRGRFRRWRIDSVGFSA